jgi:hypothetical protein
MRPLPDQVHGYVHSFADTLRKTDGHNLYLQQCPARQTDHVRLRAVRHATHQETSSCIVNNNAFKGIVLQRADAGHFVDSRIFNKNVCGPQLRPRLTAKIRSAGGVFSTT